MLDNLEGIERKFGKFWRDKFEAKLLQYQRHLNKTEFGEFPDCVVKIRVKNQQPIVARPYNIPYHEWPILAKLLKDLLSQGIIELCDSKWNNPFFLMKKQSGKMQLVVDTRRLNNVTETETCQLITITDIVQSLYGDGLFSTFSHDH